MCVVVNINSLFKASYGGIHQPTWLNIEHIVVDHEIVLSKKETYVRVKGGKDFADWQHMKNFEGIVEQLWLKDCHNKIWWIFIVVTINRLLKESYWLYT